MSTLPRKFEWFLERKADIAAFRTYVRDVERRLPTIIFQWATSNVRNSISTFGETLEGVDVRDIRVETDQWATWWFKASHYNDRGRGAYFHLFVPDGIDWLEEGSEESAYMGFVLDYTDKTATIAEVVRRNVGTLPLGVSQKGETDEDGAMQIYTYHLRDVFAPSKLARSEEAAREFDDAIKKFTIPVLRAVMTLPMPD
jgi:hypothetical protein